MNKSFLIISRTANLKNIVAEKWKRIDADKKMFYESMATMRSRCESCSPSYIPVLYKLCDIHVSRIGREQSTFLSLPSVETVYTERERTASRADYLLIYGGRNRYACSRVEGCCRAVTLYIHIR